MSSPTTKQRVDAVATDETDAAFSSDKVVGRRLMYDLSGEQPDRVYNSWFDKISGQAPTL